MSKHFGELKQKLLKQGEKRARLVVARALTDHWKEEAARLELLASAFQAHMKCSPSEIELLSEVIEQKPGVFRRTYRFRKIVNLSQLPIALPEEGV